MQPIRDATAMWAYDFRSLSHSFHLAAFRPRPRLNVSTGRLCHITPRGSGTTPNIFLLNLFSTAP